MVGNPWFRRIYNFKETWESSVSINPAQTAGFASVGYVIAITNAPLWNQRRSTCDQYKIYKWKFVVSPVCPAPNDFTQYKAAENTSNLAMGGEHGICVDYTDASAIPNWDQLRNCTAKQIKSIAKPLKVIFRPRWKAILYESGTTTGFGYGPRTGWIDRADENVPHYGIKYAFNFPGFNSTLSYPAINLKIINTLYYGVKNVYTPR